MVPRHGSANRLAHRVGRSIEAGGAHIAAGLGGDAGEPAQGSGDADFVADALPAQRQTFGIERPRRA